MTRQSDRKYYAARAEVERALSLAAIDPLVADIHAKLAEGYERLTTLHSGADPFLRIVTT